MITPVGRYVHRPTLSVSCHRFGYTSQLFHSEGWVRLVRHLLLQKRLPLYAFKAIVIFHLRCGLWCLYSRSWKLRKQYLAFYNTQLVSFGKYPFLTLFFRIYRAFWLKTI